MAWEALSVGLVHIWQLVNGASQYTCHISSAVRDKGLHWEGRIIRLPLRDVSLHIISPVDT